MLLSHEPSQPQKKKRTEKRFDLYQKQPTINVTKVSLQGNTLIWKLSAKEMVTYVEAMGELTMVLGRDFFHGSLSTIIQLL